MAEERDDDSKIFPQRLMEILAEEGHQEAISWLPHGRAFVVRDRNLFADKVMPKYFSRHAKYSSFTRKLNRWNFVRVSSGPELGAYYHEFFLRDKPHLAAQMFCKNARSKLAMRSKTPPPQRSGGEQQQQLDAGATGRVGRSLSPPNLPTRQQLVGNPAAIDQQRPSAIAAPSTAGPPAPTPLAVPTNPAYSLPPDIPLGLLEALTKGPASSSASAMPGMPTGRLLQQSQYANLLVERQIQILQAEQAKLVLLKEVAAIQAQEQELVAARLAQHQQKSDAETLQKLMELKLQKKRQSQSSSNRGPVNHRASAA